MRLPARDDARSVSVLLVGFSQLGERLAAASLDEAAIAAVPASSVPAALDAARREGADAVVLNLEPLGRDAPPLVRELTDLLPSAPCIGVGDNTHAADVDATVRYVAELADALSAALQKCASAAASTAP